MPRSPNRWYLALLGLVVVLFYWRTLLTNQFTLINGSEGVNTTYAWLHFLVRSVRSGQAPLWDPCAYAGSPFAGALLPSAFYPMHLLFALVPLNRDGMIPPHFYDAYMALVHLICAYFMFGLLRELSRSRYASFVGACVFSLGGLVGKMMWPFYVEACIWLPVVFLFLLRALRAERRDRALVEAAGAGAALAMSILTGGMSFFIMEAIFLATAAVWYAAAVRRVSTPARVLAVSVAVAAGLGAIQLLPANEYGKESLRFIDGGTYPSALRIPYARMVPGMYPQSIVSGLFPTGYNGKIGGEETFPYYVGVLPLLLALIGIWKCWSNLWVRYLTGLAVLAFLYSLGEFSPLNGVLYAIVPMLWVTRAANRFLFLVSFALAVLSAFGLDAILDAKRQDPSWLPVARILRWVAIAAGAALVLPALITTINLGNWNALSLLLILGSCGLLILMMRREASPGLRVIIAAFILFDLSAFNWLEAAKKPGDQLDQMISLHGPVEFVKARAGLRRVRVAIGPEPNIGDVYGVQGMWGGWPTALTDYSKLRVRDDLLNVGYVIRPASAAEPGPIYQDARWKVYANPAGFPRAWVVHQTVTAPSHDAAFAMLDQPGLDLHRTAITERPLAFGTAAEFSDIVRFRSYDERSMTLAVTAGSAGLLVLSEMYYPGWEAVVNGKPVAILPVDGALRGIRIPAGGSRVKLEFVSGSFRAGALISLLTMLGVIAGWLYSRFRGAGTRAGF